MNTLSAIYLLVLSAVIFYSYVIVITKKYGLLPDISSSYYESGCKPYFTLFSFGIAVPMMMVGVEHHSMFMLSSASICFMGVAAGYRDEELFKTIHYVCAVGGITCAWVGFGLIGYTNIMVLLFLGAVVLFYTTGRYRFFFIEVWCYSVILLGLFYITVS
jgi:hypothetical protein